MLNLFYSHQNAFLDIVYLHAFVVNIFDAFRAWFKDRMKFLEGHRLRSRRSAAGRAAKALIMTLNGQLFLT